MNATTADQLHQLIAKWRERKTTAQREAGRRVYGDAHCQVIMDLANLLGKCADELEAALLAAPLPQPAHTGLIRELAQELVDRYTKPHPVAERHGGCGWCGGLPHSVNCLVGRMESALTALPQPAMTLPEGAVGDLLAYGRDESNKARIAKDRDAYQFWQGWNTALERLPQPEGWQPIESAPKDESWLLLWDRRHVVPYVGRWFKWMNYNSEHGYWQSHIALQCEPTAWMPLPPAPLVTDKEHP